MQKNIKLGGLAAAALVAAMTSAQAQATRTWVSGVGDDVNPCSRTAPCKTFAGAISKTAAGGEIDVLDPGGFGGVTITKSMTIDGSGGSIAGVLVAAGPGMTINDSGAGTAQVTIRNIDFEGVGFTTSSPGTFGIRFASGATLNVQHCVIRNFRNATNGTGISFTPSTAARLYVDDTILTGNGNGAAGGGIVIQPTVTGSSAVLTHVRAENNANVGLVVNSSSIAAGGTLTVTATDSVFAGSTIGVVAISGASSGGNAVTLVSNTVSNNTNIGVLANGAQTKVFLSQSVVSGNGTGITANNSGTLSSYGDNVIPGLTPGAATPPTLGKL